MTDSNKSISLLRQRMIEDMTLRKLSPKTQSAYIRAVKKLTQYLRRSPDTATTEELRLFQLEKPRLEKPRRKAKTDTFNCQGTIAGNTTAQT